LGSVLADQNAALGFGAHPTACSANAAMVVQGMSAKIMSHQPMFLSRIRHAEKPKRLDVSTASGGSLIMMSRRLNASSAATHGKSGAAKVVVKRTRQDAGSVHCGRAEPMTDTLAA
jgi:hypothetical protein